jgi:hypothetical protein
MKPESLGTFAFLNGPAWRAIAPAYRLANLRTYPFPNGRAWRAVEPACQGPV